MAFQLRIRNWRHRASDKKIAGNIEKLSVCLLQAVGRVAELVCDHPKAPEIIRATTIRKRDFVVAIENVGTDHIYGIERTTPPGAYRRHKRKIGRSFSELMIPSLHPVRSTGKATYPQ